MTSLMAASQPIGPAVDLLIEPMDRWFVWTKTGRRPAFAHPNEAEARAEALRLARICPGKKFIVMQAVSKLSVVASPAATEEAA